jgi:Tfp pilus assembly protein PilF
MRSIPGAEDVIGEVVPACHLYQRLTRRWHGRRFGLAGLVLVVAGLAGFGVFRFTRATSPESGLQQGREALVQGDIARSEKLADQLAASGHPDHAHLLKGQLWLRLNRPNEAILEYNAIRQENQDLLVEASVIYGLEFLAYGDVARARKLLQWVVSVRPENLEAHRALAALYYDQRVPDFAIQQVERWSAIDMADGQPERFLGRIYLEMDEPDRAITHYRAALERSLLPSVREQARVELAELLIRRRALAPALEVLEGGAWESVDRAQIALLRAECLGGLGRGEEAARAIDAAPGAEASPRRLRLQARLRLAGEDLALAASLLQRALELDRHDVDSREELARLDERLGRQADAAEQRRLLAESQRLWQTLRELKKKAFRRGNDPAIRRQVAGVCSRLGKQDWADQWLQAAQLCPIQENVSSD